MKLKVRLLGIRNLTRTMMLDSPIDFEDYSEDLSGEDEYGEYDYNEFNNTSKDFIFTFFNPQTLTLTDVLIIGPSEDDVNTSDDVNERINEYLGNELNLDLANFNVIINTIDERGLEIEIDTEDLEVIGCFTAPLSYVQSMDKESEGHFTYTSMSDIEIRLLGRGMKERCYPSIEPLDISNKELEVRDFTNITRSNLIDLIENNLGEFYQSTIG